MGQIESPGTYIAEILDHGLGDTRKGYPQFVGRFHLKQKYVEELHELEHFHQQGVVEARDEEGKTFDPQWVDWSEFSEYGTGYFVLFNDAESFDKDSKLLNYDQLQLATGWAGDEFESFNDGRYVGMEVLVRVDEEEYNGQTQLKINWIDSKDASPGRELRKAEPEKVKSLQSKLKMGKSGGSKAAKSSKPASKPSKPSEQKEEKAEEKQEKPKAPPKKGPPKKDEQKEEQKQDDSAGEEQQESETTEGGESEGLPTAVSQTDAWEFVCNHKGDNADSAIEEAWISACEEVGPETDEDQFTEEMWAQVRDIVVRDLALDV